MTFQAASLCFSQIAINPAKLNRKTGYAFHLTHTRQFSLIYMAGAAQSHHQEVPYSLIKRCEWRDKEREIHDMNLMSLSMS